MEISKYHAPKFSESTVDLAKHFRLGISSNMNISTIQQD